MAATARHFLLHRLRLRGFQGFSVAAPQGHRLWCSATPSPEEATSNPSCGTQTGSPNSEVDDLEWRKKEEKIARDVEPIVSLTMQILYSSRYMNGEILTMEDERAVVENILIYHPDYEDKIGSGLNSIMSALKLSTRDSNVERLTQNIAMVDDGMALY
ncbi:uncharacterized protein LOC114383150 isoform X2 [Glycine soja]|uniref:Uncharacterized protein n=2 Tax=Glycine subgen. Soja TaxID=1462606 RepID=I1M8Q8_SOYBN|nr:uncharacterized protein LOC100792225 isoform X2 [Glycine max]XP_028198552.1 uncharacterized protein LOC114383150 isoform X2 [Glycine soja]RZB68132.1 Protein DCL-like, chloroplastic isoform B [Glycine soja]|eukprot:XP_014622726.1 uncharacterized protein LOC100792225 isoform X2 [Glycine max]